MMVEKTVRIMAKYAKPYIEWWPLRDISLTNLSRGIYILNSRYYCRMLLVAHRFSLFRQIE
jgi:hypothetical protein